MKEERLKMDVSIINGILNTYKEKQDTNGLLTFYQSMEVKEHSCFFFNIMIRR